MEVLLTLKKENGILQPTKRYSDSNNETGHPVFNSISALSRGVLQQKEGKNSIQFNGDSTNTELLFQTIHSVNQLSIHGGVVNWCHQFGLTEEEKRRFNLSTDKKC